MSALGRKRIAAYKRKLKLKGFEQDQQYALIVLSDFNKAFRFKPLVCFHLPKDTDKNDTERDRETEKDGKREQDRDKEKQRDRPIHAHTRARARTHTHTHTHTHARARARTYVRTDTQREFVMQMIKHKYRNRALTIMSLWRKKNAIMCIWC